MSNKQKIIQYCCNVLGLDTVGFTSCRKFKELEKFLSLRKDKGYENEFEEKDILKRINPNIYMEEGKAIISIAFPYIFNKNFNNKICFSKYTMGRDYHIVVAEYLKKLCAFIESLGGKAKYLVDSNTLPERYIAKLCGIGFIGKNNMIITKKYGSYVFLGEIITDLELDEDEPLMCQCGECELCLKACPAGSIGEDINNPNVCLSYVTQKKEIEDIWFDKLQGRIFGCDNCQKVCPYNKEIDFSGIEEFKPFVFMENPNIEEIINMNNRIFKDKYALTSSGWRGKNILIRNALISSFAKGEIHTITIKEFSSPYVKDYYGRLLRFYKL
ncbi:tRNA epoxyqueuosine(34) reductase QueG [Clostridium lundense]|uniref:tRNA epoxyqueuosine(34) reductase QueG n=1 Tax=Clostridium lundense TaxID=319475 RepID=UPI000480596E|nr:tRNA epoxyqueuosine(34) reductase QueG [Clostridium lundense]